MELGISQIQSQVQKPIITIMMSPQMQQAIHLLQLPILELTQAIEQEMAQNPLLEEVPVETPAEQQEAREEEVQEKEREENLKFKEEFDVLARLDDEWREFFQQANVFTRRSEEEEEKRAFLEASITEPESLHEHLIRQMVMASSSAEDSELGEFIIGNMDADGYLRLSVEELAQTSGKDEDAVRRVVGLIQTFDPNGVGARDLQECLLIQLRNLGNEESLAARILRDHFDLLGKKKLQEIARALKVKVLDVQEAVKEIVRLNLRPGSLYGGERTQYIVPDITLRREGNDFEIIINDERIPHLRISPFYRRMMAEDRLSPEVRDYIKEKIHSGRWLIKNIHQRHETLYNITNEILRVQKPFLLTGKGNLKPLTMHQIAETVRLHESTVSRAISKKYIDTPYGVFPLKFFFTSGIETMDGGEVSSHNVKTLLQEVIDKEDPKKPLSDEVLVKMLNDRGMKIARRTIAKYRKELNILPSHLRKSY